MAERVGFEPTNELPHCWFSRPVLLTAQPPFQNVFRLDFNIFIMNFTQPQFLFISLSSRHRQASPLKSLVSESRLSPLMCPENLI